MSLKTELIFFSNFLGKIAKNFHIYLRFFVLPEYWEHFISSILIESTIFWDITQCSPVKMNQRFGGTFCLHLQSQISRAYQREGRWQTGILLSLFDPEDGDRFLRNVSWLPTDFTELNPRRYPTQSNTGLRFPSELALWPIFRMLQQWFKTSRFLTLAPAEILNKN
jgi:hypothetical protein